MRRVSVPPPAIETLAAEVSAKGGRLQFEAVVYGTSMSPTIRHGDLIIVEAAAAEQLEIGELIVYRGPTGRDVAHRLIGKRETRGSLLLTTRADSPTARDETVAAADVRGRIVKVEHRLRGHLLDRLPAPAVRMIWKLERQLRRSTERLMRRVVRAR